MELVNSHYEDFSLKSRDYFVRNHALSTVGEQFVGLLRKLNFTFDEIDPKVMKPLWIWETWVKIRKSVAGKKR